MGINLRNLSHTQTAATNLRHIALVPEVQHAVLEWVRQTVGTKASAAGVLIGGLAMSFYARPRETTDIDLLFLTKASIPDSVLGFKRIRVGAFQENKTHVEVEVTYPEAIHIPQTIAHRVFYTAVMHSDLQVASREAMIALKLWGSDTPAREFKDLADVVALVDSPAFDRRKMHGWDLSAAHLDKLDLCISKLKT